MSYNHNTHFKVSHYYYYETDLLGSTLKITNPIHYIFTTYPFQLFNKKEKNSKIISIENLDKARSKILNV